MIIPDKTAKQKTAGYGRVMETTESLCSVCLKKLEAEILESDGKVYISKTCPEHGNEQALIWSDAETYYAWSEFSVEADPYPQGSPVDKGCPFDCGYCEEHTGSTCTAVIEVTDRCNMGCAVCFAGANEGRGSHRPIETIREMIRYTAETQGFCSLQLSGGEPTMRDDLPEILRYARQIGFRHIQVNSNGIRLAREPGYAKELHDAGAVLIYLGFDGIDDSVYQEIRNRDMLDIKKACIENCRKAGIGVMLVPVIVKGLNDHQVGDIVAFGKAHMPTVKGIHYQPASRFGRYEMGSGGRDDDRYTIPDLLRDLEGQTEGEIQSGHIMPRKKQSAHCSFSSAYYLDESRTLKSLTSRKAPVDKKSSDRNSASCGCKGQSDAPMSRFARSANDFTERYWRQNSCSCRGESLLDKFFDRLEVYSFTISGMPFQDAGNLDIHRVRNCCVSVIDESLKAIPLCLYYLTDREGNRLYKGGRCTVC